MADESQSNREGENSEKEVKEEGPPENSKPSKPIKTGALSWKISKVLGAIGAAGSLFLAIGRRVSGKGQRPRWIKGILIVLVFLGVTKLPDLVKVLPFLGQICGAFLVMVHVWQEPDIDIPEGKSINVVESHDAKADLVCINHGKGACKLTLSKGETFN